MKFVNTHSITSQALKIADFTDNANTTGYIDFDYALPAGVIPIAWKAVATTGFTGDTSAVISVGISGDTDAFSADTAQSVFAAGTVGSSALAAAACDGIGDTVTPRVTVTGGSDFGGVTAGEMTVEIIYLDV